MSRRPVDPDLLLTHSEFVRRMARALMRNEHDADDLVQDTYAAALERGPKRDGPLRPWLAGVVKRRAADAKRKGARRAQREERAAKPEAIDAASTVAARAELGRRVVDAVMALREPYRTAVLLRHYDGMPPRKIAAKTGVPVETVRTRVRRGLAEVRVMLSGDSRANDRSLGVALALLAQPRGASVFSVLAGVAAVKKAVLAAALLIGALAIWHFVPESADAPPHPTPAADEGLPGLKGTADLVDDEIDHVTGTARVVGTVYDGGAPAVAQVALHALPVAATRVSTRPLWTFEDLIAAGAPVATTRSAADGTFGFDAVAAGHYELRASSGGRYGTTTVWVPHDGARVVATVSLASGEVLLRGKAVYADGRPFRGHIRVHRRPGLTQLHAVVRNETRFGTGLFATDENGAFVVRGVAPGRVVLSAFVPGRVRYVSSHVELPSKSEFVFVVDDGARAVQGRVVRADGGAPVPHAIVTVTASQSGTHRTFVRVGTDADGRFRAHIAGVDVGVHVRAAGFAEAWAGARIEEPITGHYYGAHTMISAARQDPAPLDVPIVVRLLASGSIFGVVSSDAGPQAGVSVYAAAESMDVRTAWRVTTSDAEGRYRIDGLPPGDVIVFAAGPGWVSRDLDDLTMAGGAHGFATTVAPGADVRRDLRVATSGRIRGRVIDENGDPVSACSVHAGPSAFPFPTQTLQAPAWLGATVTDADGAFVVDPLLTGFAHKLYANAGDRPIVETEPIFVAAGELDPVEIRLPATRWIEVRVTDESTHDPIPDARVRIGGVRGTFIVDQWVTNAEGMARIGPLPASQYYLAFVEAAGYVGARRPATIEPKDTGSALARAEIVLTRGAVIAGTIVAPQGVPVVRAVAQLQFPRKRRRSGEISWRTKASVNVGSDGRFRFSGLEDGEYRVRAELQWDVHDLAVHQDASLGDTDLRLELADVGDGPTWAVNVKGADGGRVFDGRLRFRLNERGGRAADEATDIRNGRAVFRSEGDVASASITVFACRDDTGRQGAFGAVTDLEIDPAGGEIDVTLPAPRSLTGAVMCEGRPVEGVVVAVAPPGWTHVAGSNAHAHARTDASGAFVLRGLGGGPHAVHVHAGYDYMQVEPTLLASLAPLTIELERSAGPTVTVLDAAGRPTNGVRVELRDPGQPYLDPISGRGPANAIGQGTGNDGKARLRNVPTGRAFDLHVVPKNTAWASQVVRDWTPADTTVRLEEALTIEGTVATQERSSMLRLWYRRDGHAWARGSVASNHAFVISGLSRGERVRVFATGGLMPPSGDEGGVELEAGARNVTITPKASVTQRIHVRGWDASWENVMLAAVPRGLNHSLVGVTQTDGSAKLYRLEAGREYALFVGPTPDGRYGWVPSFLASENELSVDLVKGERIEGTIEPPEGATIRNAFVRREGLTITVEVDEQGRFRLDGLRPGKWLFFAYARRDGDTVSAAEWIETGTSSVIKDFTNP